LGPLQESAGRLSLLMFFRVLMITFLLGATLIVQLREPFLTANVSLTGLYALIITVYLLTFFYALLLPRLAPVSAQAYIQSIGDVLMTTVIIYLTGGIESIFSFVYILSIINASFVLYRRGALIIASLSIILYGLVLDLQYYQYITPAYSRGLYTGPYWALELFYRILINMVAFYLVAFLSGYLSQQAEETRQKLEARESDLKRLERLNESIVQSIDAGLMTLEADGGILSLNPAAARITGRSEAEVRGRPYSEVFPRLELSGRAGLTAFPDRPLQLTYERPDGRPLWLEMSMMDLKDQAGSPAGQLLVFQDRTHIHQMEEDVKRVEKLAAVGELAAGIAHEIRNPLASMSGSIQMLEAELMGKPGQEPLMKIIRREMDRLDHIVHDFLLFARPRAPRPCRLDLAQAVEDLVRDFNRQAPTNKVRLEVDRKQGVFVHFDPHQLEQIFWNLLRNAQDAVEDGGEVTVRVDTETSAAPRARIRVQDTGPGIAAQHAPYIFDPFFTTKQDGTGLGLSIISRILEQSGGHIKVTSHPGVGTTFTVLLPLSA
jgi:two-component system sensor histidine kinase PilS (NtrC family)